MEERYRLHRALYRAWILVLLSKTPDHQEAIDLTFLSTASDKEMEQLEEAHVFLRMLKTATVGKSLDSLLCKPATKVLMILLMIISN